MISRMRLGGIVVGLCVAAGFIGMARTTAPPDTSTSPTAVMIVAAMASGGGNGPCAQCRELPGPERGECIRACIANVGSFCGGIAGITCPEGLVCVLDSDVPDAPGTCRVR